eukprot:1524183-Prymnesium_polylepis.1
MHCPFAPSTPVRVVLSVALPRRFIRYSGATSTVDRLWDFPPPLIFTPPGHVSATFFKRASAWTLRLFSEVASI